MRTPVTAPLASSPRPAWMDGALALPVGVLLATTTGAAEGLKASVLALSAGAADPTRLEVFVSHLAAHWLVPALLVWLMLRFTRLGAWLAPNRLSVGGLLVANGLMLFYAARGVFLASQGQPPFFGQDANRWLTPVLTASLALGLGTLAASTLWHRHLAHRPAMRAACRRMMSEI